MDWSCQTDSQRAPLAEILLMSQEFSFDMVEAALRLGASGYVHKLRVQSDLLPAIESVLRMSNRERRCERRFW